MSVYCMLCDAEAMQAYRNESGWHFLCQTCSDAFEIGQANVEAVLEDADGSAEWRIQVNELHLDRADGDPFPGLDAVPHHTEHDEGEGWYSIGAANAQLAEWLRELKPNAPWIEEVVPPDGWEDWDYEEGEEDDDE